MMSRDEAYERMVAHRELELVKFEKRIAELEATLGLAYGHLLHGSATNIARYNVLTKMREALRWPDVSAEVNQRIKALQKWASPAGPGHQ